MGDFGVDRGGVDVGVEVVCFFGDGYVCCWEEVLEFCLVGCWWIDGVDVNFLDVYFVIVYVFD